MRTREKSFIGDFANHLCGLLAFRASEHPASRRPATLL
ncbi:hypothetical protein W911_15590 [Hyphomicrobium nitrativorans NL23]|uniref:Uncharacterized protein n=1 Tax=Hyphomicrobium nitrativorans NL23 TaxID=1029756 RepID=V5SHQ4_9HYPH|nr:hypothetical protein W911_15590 [Hyphomicrobium nitrativorans NL23]